MAGQKRKRQQRDVGGVSEETQASSEAIARAFGGYQGQRGQSGQSGRSTGRSTGQAQSLSSSHNAHGGHGGHDEPAPLDVVGETVEEKLTKVVPDRAIRRWQQYCEDLLAKDETRWMFDYLHPINQGVGEESDESDHDVDQNME